MSGIAVSVKNVSKKFRIPLDKSSGIKQHAINIFRRKRGFREFGALENISFDVQEGDFFGIVGRNGSGKSTLLKTIAQIYQPDKGAVHINGSLVPFIELGVGFNPDLSGRENVFLNGALLGFSRPEIEALYDDIVDFAELHDFMEERLKNYSSGMQVRLAFSIAVRAESSILLLDEVLAVGDEAFQKKCYAYFDRLKKEKKTVILVSHDMESVNRFCDRVILIDKGKTLFEGSPKKAAELYTKINQKEDSSKSLDNAPVRSGKYKDIITVTCNNKQEFAIVDKSEKIKIEVKVKFNKSEQDGSIGKAVLGMTLENEAGVTVFRANTLEHGAQKEIDLDNSASKRFTSVFEIDNIFPEGRYFLDVALVNKDRSITYERIDNAIEVKLTGYGKYGWLLHPDVGIEINHIS